MICRTCQVRYHSQAEEALRDAVDRHYRDFHLLPPIAVEDLRRLLEALKVEQAILDDTDTASWDELEAASDLLDKVRHGA